MLTNECQQNQKKNSFSFKTWYKGMTGYICYSGDSFMSFTLCNLFISFTHVQLKTSSGLITLDKGGNLEPFSFLILFEIDPLILSNHIFTNFAY